MASRCSSPSFTIVELLATIAIMAVLIAGAIYYTASYAQWAKQTTELEICTVLNDELTRYKSNGGNIAALTAGAPIGDIFAQLQTAIVPAGMPASLANQFMASNYTYPGRSLSAAGTGQQYHFTRVDSYQASDYTPPWYSVSNTGGGTGTIVVNFTTQLSGGASFTDTENLYAISNGTPGVWVGGGGGAWPTTGNWLTEKVKTWYGGTPTSGSYSNGNTMTLTISNLPAGSYTLQLWDIEDGAPPGSNPYDWEVPNASQSFNVAAGQTYTINAFFIYNTVGAPVHNFYNSWVVW